MIETKPINGGSQPEAHWNVIARPIKRAAAVNPAIVTRQNPERSLLKNACPNARHTIQIQKRLDFGLWMKTKDSAWRTEGKKVRRICTLPRPKNSQTSRLSHCSDTK
jgi:hypothetical protein